MQKEVVISTKTLTKYYGSFIGSNNISFKVYKGEIFGFLGPNGAGKTTTIRMLLDLLRPTSGEIKIFGSDIRKNSFKIRQGIGYLPGEFAAYSHLTAIEYFNLIARIRKVEFNSRTPLIKRFDLSEKDLEKKTRALSHGMLQKIGIIQALFHKPKLLILDEPTTGLDPLMKEVFYEVLREEQQKGTTIFFSSHNLDEVEKLCERVAIIRKGELVALEDLDALKTRAGQIIEFSLEGFEKPPELPGADFLDHWNKRYRYRFSGNISDLLKKLNDLPVQNLSISKPNLEDIFTAYYKQGKR